MKHNTSEVVRIINTNQVKVISVCELIDGVEIYYMTDNTSFSRDQLKTLSYSHEELIELISDNTKNIISFIDFDNVINTSKKWNEKHFPRPKAKYWPFPLLNLFPKVSRLWTSRG